MVVQRLLEAASQPYFQMLELWLCQGLLNDPYAEFMVEEDKVLPEKTCNICMQPAGLSIPDMQGLGTL